MLFLGSHFQAQQRVLPLAINESKLMQLEITRHLLSQKSITQVTGWVIPEQKQLALTVCDGDPNVAVAYCSENKPRGVLIISCVMIKHPRL
jgi:hypothetical protein